MIRGPKAHIAGCDCCLKFKCKPEETALENIKAIYPLEKVYLDYLTTEATEDGKNVHALFIMVNFTRYA